MKKLFLLTLSVLTLCFAACSSDSDDDNGTPIVPPAGEVTIGPDEPTDQSIWADDEQGADVSFTTSGAWTSEIIYTPAITNPADEWVTLDPESGDKADTYTVTITTLPNDTDEDRSAEIRITCGEAVETITISQSGQTEEEYKETTFVEFEDETFEAYCVENFDTNGDGKISLAEAKVVTKIDVDGTYDTPGSITSLAGIEHFTTLKRLECDYNQLTALDVSSNTTLEYLYCRGNQLRSLDVSNNTALITLSCSTTKLTSLDVSNNTALITLSCFNNQLTSLDVSQNTALITLSCNDNELTTLDVSQNKALEYLYCIDNELTILDVSQNTALTDLTCKGNKLTTLDMSNNTALITLSCFNNQLTSLDVSQNTALTYLACDDNELTILDVSQNTALTDLTCDGNKLATLDISNNAALTGLDCSENLLTTLDISQNTALADLYCSGNPDLTELWMATGQEIANFSKDNHTEIKYK